MRQRRSKLRWLLKWAGLLIFGVVTIGGSVSLYCLFGYEGESRYAAFNNGSLVIANYAPMSSAEGWAAEWTDPSPRYWPTYKRDQDLDLSILTIPLWMPAVVVVIPTIWLWGRDQRLRAENSHQDDDEERSG
ncbi:MAG: hypothetical protein JSU63_11780 [Phycisphaerales bacterium]|nr:MAG: hypothetical protein JSU63_11780 [Phycisphaerales bacterium]